MIGSHKRGRSAGKDPDTATARGPYSYRTDAAVPALPDDKPVIRV
jgi:hypothetical protein